MSERQPLVWPDNCKLAFWINISVQFFPLNQKALNLDLKWNDNAIS